MALKTITIAKATGKVVAGDRDVLVTARKSSNAADQVKWVLDSTSSSSPDPVFFVVFGSPYDPFAEGRVIRVPALPSGSIPQEIAGLPGAYKYSVVQVSTGEVKDDPYIIIKS